MHVPSHVAMVLQSSQEHTAQRRENHRETVGADGPDYLQDEDDVRRDKEFIAHLTEGLNGEEGEESLCDAGGKSESLPWFVEHGGGAEAM